MDETVNIETKRSSRHFHRVRYTWLG